MRRDREGGRIASTTRRIASTTRRIDAEKKKTKKKTKKKNQTPKTKNQKPLRDSNPSRARSPREELAFRVRVSLAASEANLR